MKPEVPETFDGLLALVERLRSPDGCPWDREQTHRSLKRTLLEECYEVLEAIDRDDPDRLAEELGDLLIQVAFHCQMGREEGAFTARDVVRRAGDKLIRRHPHVFGDAKVRDAREVEAQWERLKRREKPDRSAVEGIPAHLPALAVAQLMQDRVARQGFDWDDVSGVYDKVLEELEELRLARTPEEREREVGDLLFAVVNLARWLGVHAEDALRQANARFADRYRSMERSARERGVELSALPMEEKERLWQEAKEGEKG